MMERNDRKLVVALAGALACALLAIAFLLGRISAKPANLASGSNTSPAASSAPVVPAASWASAPPPAASAAAESAPLPAVRATSLPSFSGDRDGAPSGATVPGSTGPASTPSPERLAIAAYFAQVERLEDMGAGDPQAFATSMLQSVSSGDFSSFDDLLAKSRTQRDRLRAIVPPRACAEHHRFALALSDNSISMLERLRAAIQRGDTTALLTITTEGHTLEEQANRLKTMGDAIKRQAGV